MEGRGGPEAVPQGVRRGAHLRGARAGDVAGPAAGGRRGDGTRAGPRRHRRRVHARPGVVHALVTAPRGEDARVHRRRPRRASLVDHGGLARARRRRERRKLQARRRHVLLEGGRLPGPQTQTRARAVRGRRGGRRGDGGGVREYEREEEKEELHRQGAGRNVVPGRPRRSVDAAAHEGRVGHL